MSTIKILHVVPSFGLGGMEKIICSIINHSFQCYQHNIVSLDCNRQALRWIKTNNIEILDCNKSLGFSIFLKCLYKEIKRIDPHILMTYNWGGTDAIWLGRLAGIRHIIHHEHGFSIEEANNTLLRRDISRFILFRMASSLVTVSSKLGTSLQKKYNINHSRIKVIRNGINTSYYTPDKKTRFYMRNKLNFSNEDFIIVFAGRLDPVKNFELLLEVFDRCHKADRTVKLLIVGDGQERPKIEHICRQKKLQDDLVMVGQRSEVLPYLRAGDAFLLTSLTEQMPLIILEAMSVGLPVIAPDIGEIHTIIDDGKDGFLRNVRDGCEGFTTALLKLKQASTWQTISHAAREKIVHGFQEAMMVRCYQTLIDSVLSHDRS